MSAPDKRLQNRQSTIEFFLTKPLLRPFQAMIIEKLVPLVQCIRCKKQARSALGKTCDIYYNLLSMIFAESALMNVICSLFLLVTSLPFPLSLAGGSWHHFTNIAFQVFIAIAPAVQVFSFILNFRCDYSHADFSLGVLQLPDHLSRC